MRTFLADRLVILGSKPGRIRGELEIYLSRAHVQSTLFLYFTHTPEQTMMNRQLRN